MKIWDNGVIREMTPEEVADWEKLQEQDVPKELISLEERIAALEQNAIGG